MVLCKIWYYSYNLKNEKNTHGDVLLLVKLQTEACNFTKRTVLHGCFSRFLNCVHGTKSRNAPHIEGMASDADLFTPTFVQTDIEDGHYDEIFPITSFDDTGLAEFTEENNANEFMDLEIMFVKVKCKIVKSNGVTSDITNAATLMNYSIESLFSRIDTSYCER